MVLRDDMHHIDRTLPISMEDSIEYEVISVKDQAVCSNGVCGREFELTTTRCFCFSCGLPYCDSCCRPFVRSNNVHPERLERVCTTCLELADLTVGVTRSLMGVFVANRKGKLAETSRDLEQLLGEFREKVGGSKMRAFLVDTLGDMNTAQVEASTSWIGRKHTSWCSKCMSKFGFFSRKYTCRLCSRDVCIKCTSQFFLYMDEEDEIGWVLKSRSRSNSDRGITVMVYSCLSCYSRLEELQKADSGAAQEAEFSSRLGPLHDHCVASRAKLEVLVSSYSLAVTQSKRTGLDGGGNTNQLHQLAKLKADITDLFHEMDTGIHSLNQTVPSSPTEMQLLKRVVSSVVSRVDFLKGQFKSSWNQFSALVSMETLEQFHLYFYLQVINNVTLVLLQLLKEVQTLDFEDGQHLLWSAAIRTALEICFVELQQRVCAAGDHEQDHRGWQAHLELMETFVNRQRCACPMLDVSLAVRAVHKDLSSRRWYLNRCVYLVQHVLRQMSTKSPESMFAECKSALHGLIEMLNEELLVSTPELDEYCVIR